MTIDIESIIQNYVDLLIIQYQQKPKARATIELFVRELFAQGILFDIRDAYNLETAVGVQLDVIGKYAGIDRFFSGQDLDGFFSFVFYSDDFGDLPEGLIGFADYDDWATKEGKWLIYPDVLSDGLRLDDDGYRFIIKLRIIQNHSTHSHKAIDDSLFEFFGTDVLADSLGNMEMFYFIASTATELAFIALEKNVLPKPMGVGIRYVIIRPAPFFGFATYNGTPSPFIEGFSNYDDYDTKEGAFVRYSNLIAP